MGIRTKIALGFVILTVAVIALVSFWAAQSLGFTVDSSDLIYLENIKNSITKQVTERQTLLNKQLKEVQKAIENAGFNIISTNNKEFSSFLLSLKENLGLDYAEVFEISKTNENTGINQIKSYFVTRLFNDGPLSYSGYIVSEGIIGSKKNIKLVIAIKPKFVTNIDDIFCIYDSKGILAANGFLTNYNLEELREIAESDSTKQKKVKDKLYRLRGFDLNGTSKLITGYSAQVATLAKSEINSMMLRLAILEILGFLILGYFWGKKIFEPMQTFKVCIDKVSDGQWQEIPAEITDNSYEEIGSVAKSFNQMVNQLSTARATLIQTEKELAKKDKMATLGRFSAGIAHEINNPLGTILMSAGMIKEAVEKNMQIESEDITTIIEEVKRCRDIIENLRTYTRKTKPNLIRTLFKDFFYGEKDIIEKENTSIKISFSFNASSDSFINVDKKAMQQVFNNIIKNAVEASNDKDLAIEIIGEETEDECIIRICDNGKGFECDSKNIFEPMFTTKAQGTGLGLVICQAIVEGHNGRIYAERLEKESLTCFNICLPKFKDSTEESN